MAACSLPRGMDCSGEKGRGSFPLAKDQDTGGILEFYPTSDGTLLIGTWNGLFRREGDRLIPLAEGGSTRWWVHAFYAADSALLIGTEHGLFRLDGGKLVPIGDVHETGAINNIN